MSTARFPSPVLVLALVGCQTFTASRPVTVLVRDAESKQPLPNADVRVSYALSRGLSDPPRSFAKTHTDGKARLTATATDEGTIYLETKTTGYLADGIDMSAAELQKIEPAHFLEDASKRPTNLVVELYVEPRPAIEILVPTGYKGIVKVSLQIADDASLPKGQRAFSVPIDSTGAGSMTGSPLLRHIDSADFVAKYSDGATLARNAAMPAIGLWWVQKTGDTEEFYVGTEREFDAFRKVEQKTSPDSPRSQGSGRRGGGGRARRP